MSRGFKAVKQGLAWGLTKTAILAEYRRLGRKAIYLRRLEYGKRHIVAHKGVLAAPTSKIIPKFLMPRSGLMYWLQSVFIAIISTSIVPPPYAASDTAQIYTLPSIVRMQLMISSAIRFPLVLTHGLL